MGTVRDVVGQCLSLRRDFNLNKVKADGGSRSYWFYENRHIYFYSDADSVDIKKTCVASWHTQLHFFSSILI